MIGAIVLAAGQSQRMGCQKLLLPFAGTTVIAHIVDQLHHSRVDSITVVTGHSKEGIMKALENRPVFFVHNPQVGADMLSSVRCGLQVLSDNCQAVLVALGDQPNISTALIDEMVRVYQATKQNILCPVYKGKRGHPLLFSIRYRREILTRFDHIGPRGLLSAYPEEVYEHVVDTPAVLTDMDIPEDYQRETDFFHKV